MSAISDMRMQADLSDSYKKGARIIGGTIARGAYFASRAGDPDSRYDSAYWEVGSNWHRNASVHILVPKDSNDPARAVKEIFDHPDRWRFDCSQFAQVVSFYAWMKVLDKTAPGKFNRRVKDSKSGRLQIKPFQGSTFTTRKLYYWRKSANDQMTLYDYRDGKRWGMEVQSTPDELISAAPVGSRVGFRNERGKENFVAEQTIKVGPNHFLAHGLGSGPLVRDAVILNLYRQNDAYRHADLAEAKKYVWVRDVAYFLAL